MSQHSETIKYLESVRDDLTNKINSLSQTINFLKDWDSAVVPTPPGYTKEEKQSVIDTIVQRTEEIAAYQAKMNKGTDLNP